MSARITLRCDERGHHARCGTRFTASNDTATFDDARAAATEHGWSCGPGGDYCPTCSTGPNPRRTTVTRLRSVES